MAEAENIRRQFSSGTPNYFDLVIVDECHRGSASEESSWREILEYFKPAIQLGLTATPNKKDGSDNAAYFGEPLYTYSLKQGIEDGFLAPFQVVSVFLDKDRDGWEPQEGERDINGQLIEKRLYTLDDFDRRLILENRTKVVAEHVTKYLHHLGRMSKTIIFCTTQNHAARMRDAIRRCNADLVAEEPFYTVRMTGDDEEGRKLYSSFTSPYEPYPVVVTTSKLLTTGADTKCVKLIVLDTPIRSMTEFKQIIGRGTRLREDAGKPFSRFSTSAAHVNSLKIQTSMETRTFRQNGAKEIRFQQAATIKSQFFLQSHLRLRNHREWCPNLERTMGNRKKRWFIKYAGFLLKCSALP